MIVEEHVSAASLTTFKVGGSVRYMVTIESVDEVPDAVRFAKGLGYPLVPFGAGSNILLPDHELEAVLVRVGVRTIERDGDTLIVAAGALWDDVVSVAVHEGLWGIENLSAIPGTMGGAVVQNIGAYGAALSDTLHSVTAYDLAESRLVTFNCTQCACGYRTTIFKSTNDRYLVLSATLALSPTSKPNTEYKDLKTLFAGAETSLLAVRDAVIAIRQNKFPPLAEFGTAGSFFLNPVVDDASAAQLQVQYPTMPVFQLPEGGIKIPLGWFFEHVLSLKGHRDGAAEAWRNQALVIVAHEGASADEIKKFAEKIIALAESELKIKITPEVRLL